jgi:4-amino-4-deoxy-L-arabinose transferase-like glycosyltransferase
MLHLATGIPLVVICTIGFFFAWGSYNKNRIVLSLSFILICSLLMRVYMASDYFLHEWDERYHALVAKNLVKHPLRPTLYDNTVIQYDSREWTANHIWLEKPPVPLWFMAASVCIVGNNEAGVRLPSILMSLLAVYLTFLLGKKLFDERIGLLAAFLHSINGIVLELAGGKLSSDHVETFFDVFTELAILFCVISLVQKNKYYFSLLAGIAAGLAILSKWTPALIVIPVWVTGAIVSGRYSPKQLVSHFLALAGGCALISLPWIIYIVRVFPEESKWVFRKFLFAYSGSIEGHSAPFWYYLNYAEIIFGEIVYIALLYTIYYMIRRKGEWALFLLTAWWLIPVIVFSFAETKRHTYLMIAAPAFFLLTAWFWFHLRDTLVTKKFLWFKYPVLILLVLLPIRFCIERMKPFNREDTNPAWAKEIRNLNFQIPEKQVVIFNSGHPIETMFYTGFTAYLGMPDSVTVRAFVKNGYMPYIYRDGILQKLNSPGGP